MKIVGRKDIFAYQWEMIDHSDTFYWGNFCFWILGTQIGYYNELTTLSYSLSHLGAFLKNSETRVYPESEKVPKENLFYELHEKYFDADYKGDSLTTYTRCRDTFWLTEIGEDSIRDKIGLILINEPQLNRQRFIWQDYKINKIEEAFIPHNLFDAVSQLYINELNTEISSLQKK